jgi:23S rRNA (cytidine1920-2'-O)/16S rRNA (cytidine1409-2'-O)-methyltransferase
LLVERGYALSRNKAQELIKSSAVLVTGVPERKLKPSLNLPDDAVIKLKASKAGTDGQTVSIGGVQATHYVARSAFKLLNALDETLCSAIAGGRCLDVGASTGGFVQVLLEKGAQEVVALDVGRGQLNESLASNPRVSSLEGINVKDAKFSKEFDIITVDVSFISVTHIIRQVASFLKTSGYAIILVKPQFEVGNFSTKRFKNGVVNDDALISRCVENIIAQCADVGLMKIRLEPAAIQGKRGNTEWVLVLKSSF